MKFEKIIKKYKSELGDDFHIYFTPGRVNLIGEHIDYQGGKVFPLALNLGTYAFVSKRDDCLFSLQSENFKDFGKKMFSINNLEFKKEDGWTNYAKGMIQHFSDIIGDHYFGLNIVIYGTLPSGSGLSSSASLEVLIGTVISEYYSIEIDPLEIALTAKNVENRYIGVECGFMDQISVSISKNGHGLLLDTNTLYYQHIALNIANYSLVILNTNKSRSLQNSNYNNRREECILAVNEINRNHKIIDFLCNLTTDNYLDHLALISDDTLRMRAEHVICENFRTERAVKALEQGDVGMFGDLMNKSHDSLRDLYNVSCIELDTLVNSLRFHGSIGARMTGAGFGGCVVALIKTSEISAIIPKVMNDYLNNIGYSASFYLVENTDGRRRLESEEIV